LQTGIVFAGKKPTELDNKVAKNAITCFVGHTVAGSYEPTIANRYLAASFILIGSDKTDKLKNDIEQKIKTLSKKLGTSEKEEGILLVYKFCPMIYELTASNTLLGNKIDKFAEKYNKSKKK